MATGFIILLVAVGVLALAAWPICRTRSSGTAGLLAEVNALGEQPTSTCGRANAGPDGRSHATVRKYGFDFLA
jgi:hypothetical protein